MINSYWIRWSSEHKKETSRKLSSIRMKASITRLRRTTHDSRLEALGVKGSYSRKATCLDNAYIEPFFSHLKTEKLYLKLCNSEAEIRQAVEDCIYDYNYRRFMPDSNNAHRLKIDARWQHSFFSSVFLTGV
ncbi:integrase core domain-containing protein [Paenibacillus sp. OK003]|uniref:integrase core domain-containing protein n=1 Tax=Paenibacillus sp. OK003 TaxID=1884380 RepID=UPI00111384FD